MTAVVTDVVCPYCGAAIGKPCRTRAVFNSRGEKIGGDNLVPFNHRSRRTALRRAR